ncbi:hypothetical protein A6A04_17845 [Paramagnetospirillum marisnigri]|uniref:Uncharacterized protein n=1 Tax=Paramagnetospirillum marisnigri TaxID=1285242 RepID=A0A178MPV7_9PROT|nr:DUF6156 family protein [Paramagnetospirillum marisnigri]OAN50593.1 hypothetical protein A6A04_17845 [Paramagnetospirillum marisnigri]
MSQPAGTVLRHFLSYSGVKLPLKLVSPLEDSDLGHRNTFMRAYFDPEERLVGCDKMVYGDIQLSHRYDYHPNGMLKRAEIVMDDELTVMEFAPDGARLTG